MARRGCGSRYGNNLMQDINPRSGEPMPTAGSEPPAFDGIELPLSSRPASSFQLPASTRLDYALALVSALLAFVLYLRTLAPGVLGGDSGEFQFAAWLGGFAHPTGYPLYLLLGWLWTHLLPLHDPAWRMNAFSALWGGVATGLVYLLAVRMLRQVTAEPLVPTSRPLRRADLRRDPHVLVAGHARRGLHAQRGARRRHPAGLGHLGADRQPPGAVCDRAALWSEPRAPPHHAPVLAGDRALYVVGHPAASTSSPRVSLSQRMLRCHRVTSSSWRSSSWRRCSSI